MSIIIQKYLDDCRDPVLSPEVKTRLTRALIPQSVVSERERVALTQSSTTSSLSRTRTSELDQIPTVEVDRSVVDQILGELQQEGARPETLELLKFLIQTEVYYELELSTDDQVIVALRYLESQGYDASVVEDCVQILETPQDSDIPNPGAFVDLLSETLRLKKYETLSVAVVNYLEQCMAD